MPIDPHRAQAIFLAAIDVTDPAERVALLGRECGDDAELRRRVELLLHAHDDDDALPGAAAPTGPHVPPPAELAPGSVFDGRYKIRQRLGEGGMGVVYVADQTEPVRRRVALKLIK